MLTIVNDTPQIRTSGYRESGLSWMPPIEEGRIGTMKAKRSNQSVSTKSSHPRNKNVIFISYSHEDREWMDRLAGHLAVLQSQNLLTLWDDRRIGAGSEWEREIKEAIEQSSVAILLITANFLRSKFIMGFEIPRLLQRREREGVEIIPVIAKPCCWKHVEWLSRMNMYPRDAQALSCGSAHEIDEQLADLASVLMSKVDSSPGRARPLRAADSEPKETRARAQSGKTAGADNADTSPRRAAVDKLLKLIVTEAGVTPSETAVPISDGERFRIGRGSANDLVLEDKLNVVSKFHAEIRRCGSSFCLYDLGSRNFTVRNEQRLKTGEAVELQSGDVIGIGTFRIECEITIPANDDDRTHFARDYVNPFIESAAHMGKAIKQIGAKYDQEATSRRLPALREALEEVIKGGVEPEAAKLVGEVLLELGSRTGTDWSATNRRTPLDPSE